MRFKGTAIQAAVMLFLALATIAVTIVMLRIDRAERAHVDDSRAKSLEHALTLTARTVTARAEDVASAMAVNEDDARRRHFRTVARTVLREPAISGLAYIERVTNAQRASYERKRFPIIAPRGRRGHPRGDHYVLDQVILKFHASAKQARLRGVNFAGDPQRGSTMMAAVDSGEPHATRPLRLLTGKLGTIVYVPIFRPGEKLGSPSHRHRAALGVVAASLRTSTLVAELKSLVPDAGEFEIADGGRMLARSGKLSDPGQPRTVDFAGRRWIVVTERTPAGIPVAAGATLASGLLLITLISTLMSQYRRRERYANAVAEQRTLELNAANEQLAIERRQLADAQRIARIGSWNVDMRTGNMYWSDELFALLGIERPEDPPTMELWLSILAEDERERALQELHRVLKDGGEFEFEFRRRLSGDDDLPVHLVTRGFADRGDDGVTRRLIGTVVDVTERRRYERHLSFLARHDSMTGLANRLHFEELVDRQLLECRRYGAHGALLMLDLDSLKEANDAIGHAAGDAMIINVAEALKRRLRETDRAARLGGDEFAVLMPHVKREDLDAVANALLAELTEPSEELRGYGIESISASIGAVMISDLPSVDHDTLMEVVDKAMYRAKHDGGGRVEIYRPDELTLIINETPAA